MKKTVIIIVGAVLAAVVCAGTVAGVILNVSAMDKIDALQTRIDESLKANEPAETAENDVTIAGEYVIRATTNISDAYKSGSKDGLSDKEKETLDMASGILSEIITDSMSDYEKELAVYEWMTQNLEHDSGLLIVIPQTQEDCDNPYGVLKYHNAVCVGYATTFRLFMQMLDIPCMVVHNSECYHSWDLTQLGGNWYHTDIYSDVGTKSHDHFYRTDYMQGMEQDWDRGYFPKADSYEYCYAYVNAQDESDIYNVPAFVRTMLDGNTENGSLRFGKELTELDAQIVEHMLDSISNRLINSAEYSDRYMSWHWMAVDDGFLLNISIANSGEEPPEIVIPDEAYDHINDALEKSFGDIEWSEYYGKGDDWEDGDYIVYG